MGSLGLALPSPLRELRDARLGGVRLFLKRDDLIDQDISGNKWRKLGLLLDDARSVGASTLLTFGGAYSNHLRAVAAAGHRFGFQTIGVVRGEERPFNESLARAVTWGMRLHYISRATYRCKGDADVLDELRGRFGPVYLIPEGGSTPFAVAGCAEIVREIEVPFDLVCCPVGTGGTLAGLAAGLSAGQRARGFSVLRGALSLNADVSRLQIAALGRVLDNWTIDHRFPFGGFARTTPELDDFATDFAARHGIELDRIYVAKMMCGIYSLIASGEIESGRTVVAVITGGPWPPPADRSTRAPTLPS